MLILNILFRNGTLMENNSKPVQDKGKEVVEDGGNPSYDWEKNDSMILIGVVGASSQTWFKKLLFIASEHSRHTGIRQVWLVCVK